MHQNSRQGEHALDEHKKQGSGNDDTEMQGEIIHIEHHSHRDEEQAHKNITIRQNAGNDAHAVLRAGQQKPCQKCTQRERKAKPAGKQGHAKAKAQSCQEENLASARAHNRFHQAIEAEIGQDKHTAQNGCDPEHGIGRLLKRKMQRTRQ